VEPERCALVEGGALALRMRVDSQNGCHHFQWWFRARTGKRVGRGHPTPHYSK